MAHDHLSASEETELVARMRAGDTDAFERVIACYYSGLLAYLAQQTRSVAAAEDILQEVFLRLWRSRDRIIVTHGLTAYLYGAVRNQLRNHARSESRARRTADAYDQNATSSAILATPDIAVENDALAVAVRQAIARLPERAREVWSLHRERGLSYAEVAAVMGISVNTVKSQMGRAVGLLRAALESFLALTVLLSR